MRRAQDDQPPVKEVGPCPSRYCSTEPGRRSAAKLVSKDEARRITANRQAGEVAAMSERLQFIIFMAFGAFCFGSGVLTAFIVTRNKWLESAVRRGGSRPTSPSCRSRLLVEAGTVSANEAARSSQAGGT